MTKSILAAAFIFISMGVFGQEWIDTLKQARSYYKQGRYLESLEYYKSAQKLAPENVDLSEEEALSAFKAGKYEDAEKKFGEAAAAQKDLKKKSSAFNNVGYSRMEQQKYAEAEESFKEALRLNPENEKARQNLVEARRIRKQKEQQQQQNQQNQQNQNQQNQQQQGQQGQNQKGNGQDQKQNQQGGQNGQQKPQQGQSGNSKQSQSSQSKLNDKQTDRKLDELMRREAGIKKRTEGSKGTANGGGTKKDW